MVDILSMVDLTSISAMLAAAGVTVGVVFAIMELRNLVKQRQTDLILKLYSTYASEGFQKEWYTYMTDSTADDYNTYRKKYAVEIPPTGLFFHEIGVLLREKLIDVDLVNRLFGSTFMRYWERAKPMIESGRRQLNQPGWGWGVEYLYNEMKRIEQRLQQTQK